MAKIKVNAGFVSREYSLGEDSVSVCITNSNFLTSLLGGLPHTLEWVVPYSEIGLDKDVLERGIKEMADGCLIQAAFPGLHEDKIEMLLDHPDFRLGDCPIID